MRILVCGDRNWTDTRTIRDVLVACRHLFHEFDTDPSELVIIEGEAKGADMLARIEAEKLGIKVLPYAADWDKYGDAAGPIRNNQMLDEGRPNIVVAFHNDLAKSKGTANMISLAEKRKIPVRVYGTNGERLT